MRFADLAEVNKRATELRAITVAWCGMIASAERAGPPTRTGRKPAAR